MKMVTIAPIIIIIIIGMSFPNAQSRPKDAGGNHRKKTRTHTMPQGAGGEPQQADPPPDHTTPQGGGKQATTKHHSEGGEPLGGGEGGGGGGGGGGAAEPGSNIYIYLSLCVYVFLQVGMYMSTLFLR